MLPQFGLLNRSSLGQLNKNITQMSKRLAKIASARKLNSAADGAADFAISEKMREQIRSLGQDMRNVQNGSSMIKTAAGGVQNIVDMLREIKKKAIDAANDSNTDEDRATIQKEINQIRSTINDVAVDTQFNGKRLLNGLYGLQTTYTKERDGWIEPPKEYTLYAGETYTKTVEADGSRKVVGKIIGVNKVKSLMGGFKAIDTTVRPASSLRSPANGGITADFGYDGTDSYWNWARAYEKSFFTKEPEKITGYFENTDVTPSTPQQVVRAFMSSLDKTILFGDEAFDEAINYCTGGTIKNKTELVDKFMNDLNGTATYTDFLKDYCDIDLTNADTGAITGSDAGGGSTKTAESVVPESSNPSSWTAPTPGSLTTINGLNIRWPTVGSDYATFTAAEEHIMKGLNSEWIKQSLDLVKETYGIDFTTQGRTVNNIFVRFENNSSSSALAYVTSSGQPNTYNLSLTVNMNFYKDIDMNSKDGSAKTTYLDRTIAHEFTHAVMSANISCFGKLPLYIKEGTAELTHGIDDERGSVIVELLTNRRSTLQNVFDTGGSQNGDLFEINAPYAAGYMLMRYLAKQGAGNAIPNIDAAYDKKYKPQRAIGPETATEINFDSSHYEDGTKLKFPASFDDQGFCILCGACGQYINFTFDKDMAMGTATMKTYVDNYARKDYNIGIGGAKNTADLAKALFEGISKAPGRSTLNDVYVEDSNGNKELVCVSVDPTHNLRIAKNPNYPADSSSEYIFLKDYTPPLLFKEGGIIDATGDENSKDNAPEGTATQMLDDEGNDVLDEDGNPVPHVETFTVEEDTVLHIWEAKYKKVSSSTGNPLVIHSGTQANQHNFYYISDMQTKSLTTGKIFDADEDYDKNEETLIRERDRERYQSLSGNPDKQEEFLETLREAENMSIDDISVTTVHDANVAMCVIDGALEYALDTATTLGAYLQRLEMTENNLVTTEENTVASESVIGDADMAKEFTEYTKANILKQASQTMLAQANQNSAGILDLLR